MSRSTRFVSLLDMNGWYFGLQILVAGGVQAAICQGKKYSFALEIVSLIVAAGIYAFVYMGSGSNPWEGQDFRPWVLSGITAGVSAVLSFAARPVLRNAVKAAPDMTDNPSDKTDGDSTKPDSGS